MPETADDRPEEQSEERSVERSEDRSEERSEDRSDDNGEWMNLGPCHYDPEHDATLVATREDGTGWIAVCEEHKSEAQENGFQPAA